MTKLEAMLQRMPADRLQQLEAFAAKLLVRSELDAVGKPSGRPNNIRLDELDGLLVRTRSGQSEEEEKRATLNSWADAAED